MSKYGLIYKATSPSGIIYIGQTTQSLEERIRKHGNDSNKHTYAFANAIKKYGIDNIKFDILHDNIPKEELNKLEIKEISKHDSFHNGYNSTEGGDFNPMDYKENREKVSKMKVGKSIVIPSGEDNHNSKLKLSEVKAIREEYYKPGVSQSILAKKHNVSRENIREIVRNNSWYDSNYVYKKKKIGKIDKSEYPNIVKKYKTGKYTLETLGKEYGVSFQLIGVIIHKFEDKDTIKIKNKNLLKIEKQRKKNNEQS